MTRNGTIDPALEELYEALNSRIAALETMESLVTQHVGNSFGGGNQTWPHRNPLFLFRESHGPYRISVNGANAHTFRVYYSDFIAKLLHAEIIIEVERTRSNISPSVGAGGAGSFVSSEGHSHSLIGAPGSASGSVTVITAAPTTTANAGTTGAPLAAHGHGTHAHIETGGTTDTSSVPTEGSHTHSGDSHSHNVNDTSGSASSTGHTHGVGTLAISGAGTHDHELPDHSHTVTLSYGIYHAPVATDPDVSISIEGTDRTSTLGGPWQADVTLDITEYMRETSEDPIRSGVLITLTTDELCDLVVTVKSVCLPSDLLLSRILT